MAEEKILKIRVSLKGRPVRSYAFSKEVVSVGRNPDCDIFLDNPGVSRNHLKITKGPGGHYQAEDVGSANGTFLNDEPLVKEYLMNDDVVRIGKFSLWFRYEANRRGDGPEKANPGAAYEGTTVLSTEELDRMLHAASDDEARRPDGARSPEAPARASAASPRTRTFWVAAVVIAFVLGTALGAGTTKLLSNRDTSITAGP